MAQIQSGASVDLLTVDSVSKAARVGVFDVTGVQAKVDIDGNLRVSPRTPAMGTLGSYAKSLVSGSIVATGSANAVIWALRWSDSTGKLALIQRVRVGAVVDGTITTSVPYNLQLFFARGFTGNPTTSIGTTATLTGGNAKLRTSMGTTLMGGIWILGTAAAGLTGQTLGNDTDAISTLVGASGQAIGSQFFGSPGLSVLWDDNVDGHPIVLAQNEGLAIQAPLAGPATGTFKIAVSLEWTEVATY